MCPISGMWTTMATIFTIGRTLSSTSPSAFSNPRQTDLGTRRTNCGNPNFISLIEDRVGWAAGNKPSSSRKLVGTAKPRRAPHHRTFDGNNLHLHEILEGSSGSIDWRTDGPQHVCRGGSGSPTSYPLSRPVQRRAWRG